MSSVQELEEAITRCRDQAQLQRLQAEYRRTAGVIRVSGPDAIHLIEHSHPHAVRAAVEVATSTLGTRSRTSSPVVSIPTRAILTRDAHEQLEAVDWACGLEVGGFFFGHRAGSDLIAEEFSCIATGEREPMTLDIERACDRRLQLLNHGLDIVGHCHSHPGSYGELRLSGADEYWATRWSTKFTESFVVMLVGPSVAGVWPDVPTWYPLRMKTWLAHQGGTVRETPLLLEEA